MCIRDRDDSAHGKCPCKKAVESVQVDFREKVQLAVDTPLEVFGCLLYTSPKTTVYGL